MRIKKIIIIAVLFLCFAMASNFIKPQIIVYGAADDSSEIYDAVDVHNKEIEGDLFSEIFEDFLDSVDKDDSLIKYCVLSNDAKLKITYPLAFNKKTEDLT